MTVKALLRSAPNRDGSHSIRIQVIKDRKTSYISTGEKIHKSYWDHNKELVKDNFPDARQINNRIDSIKKTAIGKSANENNGNFLAYWDKFIINSEGIRSIGDINKHKTSMNVFIKHMGEICSFSDLSHDYVKEFRNRLYSHYEKNNTAYSYFKKFRRVVNEALSDEKILHDPFSRLKQIESKGTESKALSKEQFNKFIKLPVSPVLKKYKDTWFALFYMRGCRIGDLLRLKFKDIEGVDIVYYMYKTGKKMSMQISEPLSRIILEMNQTRLNELSLLSFTSYEAKLKALSMHYPNEYVFPYMENGVHNVSRLVKRGKSKGQMLSAKEAEYKNVSSFTALINKNLRKISHRVETKITSHCARHTYSTLLKNKTDDIYKIMHILGHSSVVVTERYLASLPKFELHKLDEELVSELSMEGQIEDVMELNKEVFESLNIQLSGAN